MVGRLQHICKQHSRFTAVGLKPRRGDTHAVQLTPHKPAGAVWCWRCARTVGISGRCDKQRRMSESADSHISPICRSHRACPSPHYALSRLYGVNCACRRVSCLRHVSRFEKIFLMVCASHRTLLCYCGVVEIMHYTLCIMHYSVNSAAAAYGEIRFDWIIGISSTMRDCVASLL